MLLREREKEPGILTEYKAVDKQVLYICLLLHVLQRCAGSNRQITLAGLPYSSKFSWHNIFVNFVICLLITKIFLTKS